MPFANVVDDVIVVQTRYDEKDMIKQVPGARWQRDDKVWHLPLSWSTCVTLRGVFENRLQVGDALIEWAWNEVQTRVEPVRAIRDLDTWPREWTHGAVANAGKLYSFQQVGVHFLCEAGDALLADEMGTGKTVQVLSALRTLGEDSLPAVVICPNSVKHHWRREALRWLPEVIPYVIEGSAAQRKKLLERALIDRKALVIINIEAVRLHSRLAGYADIALRRCRECHRLGDEIPASRCDVHPKELNLLGARTVVVDEAHRIKDARAKQTRAVWAVCHGDTVKVRWGLTGTPLANHPGDLWSIMHALAPYEYPVKTTFLDRVCLRSWNQWGGLEVVGLRPDTRGEFFRYFDPRFRRMTKARVLPQLPAKVRHPHWAEMGPKQRKTYDELERTLITRLPDGELLIAPNNLAAAIRLMQLASSAATIEKPDPDDVSTWQVHLAEPSPKVDVLMDVLTDLGDESVVVAAEHRQLIELAAARLDKAKISYGLITGAQNTAERDRALQDFNAGQTRVLLFTLKAGGTGLDMSYAANIVFLQRSWSMVDNVQAEDRVHRIGSERHTTVNVFDIITRDTVEERQIERLTEKFRRLDEITRDRARHGDRPELAEEEQKIMGSFLGVP